MPVNIPDIRFRAKTERLAAMLNLQSVRMTTMVKIENYIGGELAAPILGRYLENFEPATGQVYSQIPDSDERDVEQAVEAAKAAFPAWSMTPAEERFAILMRLVGLIERDLESLALAESTDNGKPGGDDSP